jgi:hypothetical protein
MGVNRARFEKMRVAVSLFAILAVTGLALLPLDIALAQQSNPVRALPTEVEMGETFNVTVNFTAPASSFNFIALSDVAPAGWNVTVNTAWCTPVATAVTATGNKAQIIWGGSFSNGTYFTAVYKVAVPEDADTGFHSFAGQLEYYLGGAGPYKENIAGDYQVLFPPEFDVVRYIDETLKSPNMLHPGDTFEVFVNWTAPLDSFCSLALTDLAPTFFAVEANKTWCSPIADVTNTTDNKVEIAWYGPYAKGINFTVMYKVIVPAAAAPGSHYFPYDNCSLSWLEHSFNGWGPYASCTIGDSEVLVTAPGDIVGETRDVNANELSGVTITLYQDASGITSDASTPNYTVTVNTTGEYWLSGSRDTYFTLDTNAMPMPRNVYHPDYIDLTTLELLGAGYNLDFEGDYGLVPMNCTMSYAMTSVNHWLYTPIEWIDKDTYLNHTEWQLSNWKAMESIHSWQFPIR